jgi:hypothetical protein
MWRRKKEDDDRTDKGWNKNGRKRKERDINTKWIWERIDIIIPP